MQHPLQNGRSDSDVGKDLNLLGEGLVAGKDREKAYGGKLVNLPLIDRLEEKIEVFQVFFDGEAGHLDLSQVSPVQHLMQCKLHEVLSEQAIL